ncbi:PBP1A family penicillin-binding protein [Lentibacter algarum]|uniref:transglycosylase domain-containing protein n=1 Tax=Lentibacter algarum TaxID=576131 RepID=UPI001C069C5B|nr:PBP1A family penicillin-binding protein [Lentibacter algarum]MBU2981621.1 PBP1A family penicillin-binding protein [Lentibacter algarum]
MSNSGRKKPLVAERRFPKKPAKKSAAAKKPVAKKRKPAKRKATKPKAQRGIIRRVLYGLLIWPFKILWAFGWRMGLVCILILGLSVGYVSYTLPPVEQLFDGRSRGSVTLLDVKGTVFAWRGDQFGGAVTASSVSPHLKNAIVATEDKRFYRHFGLSPRGIASAVKINLSEGRGPLSGHGGSTLTQQTAKLICLGTPFDPSRWKDETAYEADCREGSLWRKAKEAVYAMAMEFKYTKNEILTVYINRAFLGAGARGFEAASQRYFGKSAAEVDPAEAAMLAGLLVAPSRYAPTNNLERSQARAATVVRLMEEQDYLSHAQAREAQGNPATLSKAAQAKAGGYFADWVMTTGPEFFTRNTTEDVIIRTTLDQRVQRAAEAAMQEVFAAKLKPGSKAQAAIVIMSADGAVRAVVGGRKTKVSGEFNRATQAKRQPGSSFKPFVYAAALDVGRSPLDIIEDAEYCIKVPGSSEYCPKNYDRNFHGQVTLTEALEKSYNIPAVKLANEVGLDVVRKVATEFGIGSKMAPGPAIALGASEVTLLELTGAYAGILNGGSAVAPYGLVELRLLGNNEPLMSATGGIGERVIQQEAAEKLTWMMNKVVTEGTGRKAALEGRDVAGKTGTSQSAKDAWFIGFTADYVAGVWIGYDDNTPLTGVTGSGLPAEIWRVAMKRAHEGLPSRVLPMRAPEPGEGQPATAEAAQSNSTQTSTGIDRLLEGIFGGKSSDTSGGTPAQVQEREKREQDNRESR